MYLIASCWSLFLISILIYIWPVYIAPNPERPLTCCYACTCQCLRKPARVSDEDESEEDEVGVSRETMDQEDLEKLNKDIEQKGKELEEKLLADPQFASGIKQSHRSIDSIINANPFLAKEEQELIEQGLYEDVSDKNGVDSLKLRNIVKKFGKVTAVNDFSLTVFRNEILVLLGHNGAGKTTTISIITGLIKATQGSANLLIGNQNIDLFLQADI